MCIHKGNESLHYDIIKDIEIYHSMVQSTELRIPST